MHKFPHYKEDSYEEFLIVGTLDDLTEVEIREQDLGLTKWQYLRFVTAVGQDDAEQISNYVQLYAHKHRGKIIGLRLESRSLTLTKNGVQWSPSQVQKTVQIDGVE